MPNSDLASNGPIKGCCLGKMRYAFSYVIILVRYPNVNRVLYTLLWIQWVYVTVFLISHTDGKTDVNELQYHGDAGSQPKQPLCFTSSTSNALRCQNGKKMQSCFHYYRLEFVKCRPDGSDHVHYSGAETCQPPPSAKSLH